MALSLYWREKRREDAGLPIDIAQIVCQAVPRGVNKPTRSNMNGGKPERKYANNSFIKN